MWPWYTADDKRSAAAIIALIATMIITAELLMLVAGGMVTILLTGGGLTTPPPGQWPATRGRCPESARPTRPPCSVSRFPAWLYWGVTILLGIAVLAAGVWLGRMFYRLTAPTGTGFATRADVGRELSPAACRRRATVTRPDLTRRGRARAALGQVGIPLHRAAVTGQDLWLPLENATGVIAPQQSGKTLTDLIHKVLARPGRAAGHLHQARPVPPHRHRPGTRRIRRAPARPDRRRELAAAGAVVPDPGLRHGEGGETPRPGPRPRHQRRQRSSDGAGNHRFFERRAVDVLTAYLLAAAPVRTRRSRSSWPGARTTPTPKPPTSSATIPAWPPSAAPCNKPKRWSRRPGPGSGRPSATPSAASPTPTSPTPPSPTPNKPGFDPDAFIRAGGTLYVVGSDDDAAAQAPLVTAFVQHVLDTARRLALTDSATTGRERLTPPFTAVLDEVASICPLPDLPDTLSDSAGRGVCIHYALQSPAQAQLRWGKAAATLFDNTTALTILGGLKSEDTLKWASLLVGRRLEERRSRQTGRGLSHPDSHQIGHERVDILEPAAVRQIPRGRALLIVRAMPALIVTLNPAWKRPDWTQLQADATHLRQHQATDALEPPSTAPADVESWLPMSARSFDDPATPGRPARPHRRLLRPTRRPSRDRRSGR